MFFRKNDYKEEIKRLNRRIENLYIAIENRDKLIGDQDKLIGDQRDAVKEYNMTIQCLKEVVISLEDENADYRTRLFNMELKEAKKTRTKKLEEKPKKKVAKTTKK